MRVVDCRRVAQPEVINPSRRCFLSLDLVRTLVNNLHAHSLQHRQHLRERDGGPDAVDLEPSFPWCRVEGFVQAQRQATVFLESLEALDIGHTYTRREILFVGLRKCVQVDAQHRGGIFLAALVNKSIGEVVIPRTRCLDELGLDLFDVDLGKFLTRANPHHEMQPGQHRLRNASRVVDGHALEGIAQDLLHCEPNLRVVTVAREIDEAGRKAPVVVTAHVKPRLASVLHMQYRRSGLDEVFRRCLEELVAWVGLKDLHEVLAAVAHS